MDTQLDIFLAVVRHRSFSKAAKALHITQPAVSMNIQALESYYGTKLFNRNNKSVTLTESGRALYKYAEQIMDLYDQARQALMKIEQTITGKLAIGASLTIGEYIVPKTLGLFKHMYPKVDIHLTVANTRDIEKHMLNHAVDIGLVEGPIDSPDLQLKPFMEDRLTVVIPPDAQLSPDGIITLDQLKAMPLILRERGSGTRFIMETQLKKAGLDVSRLHVIMELGSTQAIKEAVEAGLGSAIISQCAVTKEIRAGTLKTANIQGVDMKRYFYTVSPVHKALTPAAAEFMEFIHNSEWQILFANAN